jgi:hypothetical protein
MNTTHLKEHGETTSPEAVTKCNTIALIWMEFNI